MTQNTTAQPRPHTVSVAVIISGKTYCGMYSGELPSSSSILPVTHSRSRSEIRTWPARSRYDALNLTVLPTWQTPELGLHGRSLQNVPWYGPSLCMGSQPGSVHNEVILASVSWRSGPRPTSWTRCLQSKAKTQYFYYTSNPVLLT